MCNYCRRLGKDDKYYHDVCLPTGCLVVTACFGSPLSIEVQYLKEMRDTKILKTNSGKGLIEGLEAVYYSFSPQVSMSLNVHKRNRRLFRALVVSPLLKLLYVCENLSNHIKNDEIRILGMSWLVFINFLGLVFWKIIPFEPFEPKTRKQREI